MREPIPLLGKLNLFAHVIEINLPEKALTGRPTFNSNLLISDDKLEGLLTAFDWALAEVKAAESANSSAASKA